MEKVIVDGRIYKVVYTSAGNLCHNCVFQAPKDTRLCGQANEQREDKSCRGAIYHPYDMADLVKEHGGMMNFDMQDLVGKWFFIEAMGGTRLGKIISIDMSGSKFGYTTGNWKPLFPLNVALLIRFPSGDVRWNKLTKAVYEKDIEIITPEIAQIYMQANNLIIERKQNERL